MLDNPIDMYYEDDKFYKVYICNNCGFILKETYDLVFLYNNTAD